MTRPVPRDLPGFEAESPDIGYRMLLGTEGMPRSGKSHLWMTAPDPIGVVNLDLGLEGVVEKWEKKKTIWRRNFHIPEVAEQKDYVEVYKRIADAYHQVLENKDVRTVAVDTATEFWEVLRLAEFGRKGPKVEPRRAYPEVNALYRSLVRAAYDTDKNLVMVHTMKEHWVSRKVQTPKGVVNQDVWDGTYKRAGFGNSAFLIQSNIAHSFKDGQFSIRVIDCRQNPWITGMELTGDDCNFTTLGMMVFEDSTESDWR